MLRLIGIVALTGCALAFSACGGGGGGGGSTSQVSTTPLAITQENADAVASKSYGATSDTMDLGDPLTTVFGFPKTGTTSTRSPALLTLSKRLADRALVDAFGTGVVTPQATVSSDCGSTGDGSITITAPDTSTGEFNPGDTITLDFASCQFGGEGASLDGRVSLTLLSLTGDPANPSSFQVSVSYQGLTLISGQEVMHWDGAITLTTDFDAVTGEDSISASGSSFIITDGVEVTALLNFTVAFSQTSTAYAANFDFTLSSTELGGAVDVTTGDTPFTGPVSFGEPDDPTAGTMTITGSGGAVLTISPASGLAQISLDLNADGIPEYEPILTWDELENAPA